MRPTSRHEHRFCTNVACYTISQILQQPPAVSLPGQQHIIDARAGLLHCLLHDWLPIEHGHGFKSPIPHRYACSISYCPHMVAWPLKRLSVLANNPKLTVLGCQRLGHLQSCLGSSTLVCCQYGTISACPCSGCNMGGDLDSAAPLHLSPH